VFKFICPEELSEKVYVLIYKSSVMLKIHTTIIIFFLFTFSLKAQFIQNISDLKGKPLVESLSSDISGSPYLLDDWSKGIVEQGNKVSYKDVDLKYNLYKDELFFKNPKDGSMLGFALPVAGFSLALKDKIQIYRNGFPEIDNFNKKSYYQVLFDGGIKLLFKNHRTMQEVKPYNSPTTEKKFIDNAIYYVFQDNVMTKFKPSKKDFLEMFKSKSTEIADFIKNEKIDLKQHDDLVRVFVFYNTL
jgi:hypothetical protein